MKKIVMTYKEFYDKVSSGDDTNYYVKTPTGEFTKINAVCHKKSNTYDITFENDYTIGVGDKHAFMGTDGKEILAEDFNPGDEVMTINGPLKVVSRNNFIENDDVYDINIDAPHWYINDSVGIIHHNTILGLYAMQAYLEKYQDGIALFYDSEFGTPPEYMYSLGIDTDRVIHIPVTNIEELTFDMTKRLQDIQRGDKVFIFVDSLGNLASKREFENAVNENSAKDMSRAQTIKSFFRIVTPHITMKDIPCFIINHVYAEQGCLDGNTKIVTNKGLIKISDVKEGMLALTPNGYKEITDKIEPYRICTEDKEFYEIILDDGSTIKCTGNHEFLCNGEWKRCDSLTVGDDMTPLY